MSADPWKSFRPQRRLLWLRVVFMNAALLVMAAVGIGALTALSRGLRAAEETVTTPAEVTAQLEAMERRLQEARGELDVTRLQLARAGEIIRYSSEYRISADLSEAIYDVAVSEGIHPDIGFRMVKVESGFAPRARSNKGAVGYTQIKVATARQYDPDITEARLQQREVNLRLGFRYFRELLVRFNNDLELALLAYNRGPTIVDSIVSQGGDPRNGYAGSVLKGLNRPTGATRGS